jgi:hypothetical protein
MQERYEAKTDWNLLLDACSKLPQEQLTTRLTEVLLLLQTPRTAELIKGLVKPADRADLVRSLTAHIMSTPEYQLC